MDSLEKKVCCVCQRDIEEAEKEYFIAGKKCLCEKCYNICGFTSITPINCLSKEEIEYLVALKSLPPQEEAEFTQDIESNTFVKLEETAFEEGVISSPTAEEEAGTVPQEEVKALPSERPVESEAFAPQISLETGELLKEEELGVENADNILATETPEAPKTAETSVADDTTAAVETSVADDTTAAVETSVADDTTAVAETPVADDTTAVAETSVADDTTAVAETSVADDTTAAAETPVVDDTTAAAETAVVDDTTAVVETSVADDTTVAAETPVADPGEEVMEISRENITEASEEAQGVNYKTTRGISAEIYQHNNEIENLEENEEKKEWLSPSGKATLIKIGIIIAVTLALILIIASFLPGDDSANHQEEAVFTAIVDK